MIADRWRLAITAGLLTFFAITAAGCEPHPCTASGILLYSPVSCTDPPNAVYRE